LPSSLEPADSARLLAVDGSNRRISLPFSTRAKESAASLDMTAPDELQSHQRGLATRSLTPGDAGVSPSSAQAGALDARMGRLHL
jgi:hypothetical protein